VYVDAFTRSGFFGPLSLYRNMDANYELTKDLGNERVAMPSFFIGGELDPVVSANRAMVDAMGDLLPGFLGSVLIPGVGHWTQQESPEAFNQALLGFLGRL
jgi:pimeloyl-ACP methyl ester carboxylesterase